MSNHLQGGDSTSHNRKNRLIVSSFKDLWSFFIKIYEKLNFNDNFGKKYPITCEKIAMQLFSILWKG